MLELEGTLGPRSSREPHEAEQRWPLTPALGPEPRSWLLGQSAFALNQYLYMHTCVCVHVWTQMLLSMHLGSLTLSPDHKRLEFRPPLCFQVRLNDSESIVEHCAVFSCCGNTTQKHDFFRLLCMGLAVAFFCIFLPLFLCFARSKFNPKDN